MELIQQFFSYIELLEIEYIVLIVMLFVIPRLLNTFGLPVSLGAFFMGILSSVYFQIIKADNVITVFSTLGISALFLYAGLELNFSDLRKNIRALLSHLLIKTFSLAVVAYAVLNVFSLSWQISAIISLALLTPSTGFILDTLPSTKLTDEQKSWVKNKAIASEILALLLLLAFQSGTPIRLALSMGILTILIIALPFLFHFVAKRISISSPGSDFSFLLLLAVVTGTITKKLGAYYLVGAFIVGFTVNYYEEKIAKNKNHKFEDAAKFFASFFMPFYFFKAGLGLNLDILSIEALMIGLLMCVLILPIRVGIPTLQRMISSKESTQHSLPISISLLPTLVFGLILTDLVRQTGQAEPELIGGLVIYTVAMTLIPSLTLKYVLKRTDLVEVAKGSAPLNHEQ